MAVHCAFPVIYLLTSQGSYNHWRAKSKRGGPGKIKHANVPASGFMHEMLPTTILQSMNIHLHLA